MSQPSTRHTQPNSASSQVQLPTAAPQLQLTIASGEQRQRTEQFIAAQFASAHQARIHHFMPWLLALESNAQQIEAAFGLRPGSETPLFLEQYLDQPIEQLVAREFKQPVDRFRLVEVGNLAVHHKAFGPSLMAGLATLLYQCQFEWMVFTATSQVRRLMMMLGFAPIPLCAADPSKLINNDEDWGNYYRNQPTVMVGSLKTAIAVVENHPRLRRIQQQLQPNIDAACASIFAQAGLPPRFTTNAD